MLAVTLAELSRPCRGSRFMSQMTLEALRQLCDRRVTALRRRIDDLKAYGAGRPLVGLDFVVEVEKALDGWEFYEEARRKDRNRSC